MSVQIRRRREAASFLSTYVGAQGEFLVDTTNNRVQVHDGVTPGGWAAARLADLSGRNAVINGNFAINQRGYASGTSLAAGVYAHDRWKAGSGGCTYTFTQAVPDTGVTIAAGTLVQAIEAPNINATSVWLSWTGTATARVWQGSAAGTYAASPILLTSLTPGAVANVEFASGTLGLVQLESALPNAGPTRFERRSIGQELGLCTRYYQRIVTTYAAGVQVSAYSPGAGYYLVPATCAIPPMRASASVGFIGSWTLSNVSAVYFNSSSVSLAIVLQTSAGGLASASAPANGGYDLTAEL